MSAAAIEGGSPVVVRRDDGGCGFIARMRDHLRTPWYTQISVEVTMFLFMFAFMITTVVEQDLFVHKACRVNHNFTAAICNNLSNKANEPYREQVERTMANFHKWYSISSHLLPIILAFFLGSFSDRRGRKLPLLMGLFGKFVYSSMIVINAKMTTWPLEYIIYTATLPAAITGADVAIFASCFAYIADLSTAETRTIRVTILDVCYLSAIPTGVALGSYLFNNQLNRSHAAMFMINACLLLLSIIYSSIFLKWQTTDKQYSLKEVLPCGVLCDFFDRQHLNDSIVVLTKKRNNHRQLFLIMLLVAMALYTFQRDENEYFFMYTRFNMNWTVADYSHFKTFKASAFVVVMLVAVPVMSKVLQWRDTVIIMIGAWAHIITRIVYLFAPTWHWFYVAGIIYSLGPIVAPVIRSMASKVVPISERGKVFALLSVCDNAVASISSPCYSELYKMTLQKADDTGGWGIFPLTMLTQFHVFSLALCIHVVLGKKPLEVPKAIERDNETII